MYFHNENKYTPQARIVQFPLIIYFGNLSNAFNEIALIFLSVDNVQEIYFDKNADIF